MANEIRLGVSLAITKLGQTISQSVNETYDQVGNAAFGDVQTITDTTSEINLGDVAGGKFLCFKNRGIKDTSTVTQPIIYIDKVTPVVPGAAPIALHGTQGNFQFTTNDTWYAICDTGLTADVGVVAVEA